MLRVFYGHYPSAPQHSQCPTRLLFLKGAEPTTSVGKDASAGRSAKKWKKLIQAMDNPSLAAWFWEGSNSISSYKPQRCMDETALQGHGNAYKYNFTLLL